MKAFQMLQGHCDALVGGPDCVRPGRGRVPGLGGDAFLASRHCRHRAGPPARRDPQDVASTGEGTERAHWWVPARGKNSCGRGAGMRRAKHDDAERGQTGENNNGCTLMCADGYRRRRVARWSGRGCSCVLICIHILCGNA